MEITTTETLRRSIEAYKKQLVDVELAITTAGETTDKTELKCLYDNIQELIDLTQQSLDQSINKDNLNSSNNEPDPFADEFALFMAEMEKEGATNTKATVKEPDIQKELKSLEGMKCRAPHEHQWGDTMYHNALVCSVIPSDRHQNFEEIEVKVMFINPTHQEMLPCPYLMETNCKFEDDKCKYSHGEIVQFSLLQEYHEPNFELLAIGSKVLAKQSNKLWGRATVKRIYGDKCLVKFDLNRKDLELELQDIFPLNNEGETDDKESISESDSDLEEDIINMSLMNTPITQALGDWEKHTKGIGSKLMQKMGYIVGTGLGRFNNGITEPVTAVSLPPGKSLDHCMNLREKAGGDKDLFNVEKKLKRLQRKQEKQNMRAYEREKKKINIFSFLNETFANQNDKNLSSSKSKHRQEIKKETSRNLNVASLQIDEDIKRIERDVYKIKESLSRHKDAQSQVHKNLKQKLHIKQNELQMLKSKALNISHEQSIRNDKKKLTVF